ncbi:MAG: hypothetical protein H0V19_08380 [Euzebyales bacterium]|nr:hypothetical protein [Euzebyales bacterium]MBA3621877.1 hypothetical protein [Euzebyales bacterium]
MTSVEARSQTSPAASGDPGSAVPLSVRARRAVPLLVGAAALLFLVQPIGALPPKGWIPVIAGLAYVGAAALSGRVGALWGPGLIIGIWGLAPMTTNYFPEFPGMFYLVLGTGLLLAAVLGDRLQISRMSMALPVLFIGGTMFVASFIGADRYLTAVLAVLLGGWALWELRRQTDDAGRARARHTA